MIVDGGMQQRSYTYIDDAVVAIEKIIFDDKNISKHKIYNIGNSKNETTIKNFAEVMLDIYKENWWDQKSPLPNLEITTGEKFYGKGYEDCDKRIPCVKSITEDFGWNPKYNFRDTLFMTMKFFIEEINKC